MIDDLDVRLGSELRGLILPSAPDALRSRVLDLPLDRPKAGSRARRPRPWVLLVAAATALVAVVGGAFVLSGGAPQHAVSSASAPSLASPSAGARPSPSLPNTVDGRPVLTVSEAIRRRDAGQLGSDPVVIRGFWSDGSVGHSCNPASEPTGDLELYCHDQEYGITELDEMIMVIDRGGYTTVGTGAWLQPYVDNDLPGVNDLFSLPIINGQRYPPVPIVVVGHFNDPRAAQCRVSARELCRDRLVLDRIVQFDPGSVPSPAPTASPTPFPFADPPPALFETDVCAEGHPVKFAGWTTLRSLGIDIANPDEIAYIVITNDQIPIGDWFSPADPPTRATEYRLWGQRVCYSYQFDPEATGFTWIPGTTFREFRDGHHEAGEGP